MVTSQSPARESDRRMSRETRVDYVIRMITNRIADGTYPTGSQLPTYRELQAEFEVSEIVVRGAMRMLKERGLVEPLHGVGVFVKEKT